jgi:cytochrome c peroxidase
MKNLSALLFTVTASVLLSFCNKDEVRHATTQQPADVTQLNDDYPESTNDRLADLGRVLFYDKSLSLNNSVACGSCHQQSKAFCDNRQFSTGLEDQKTRRNTPSIFAKTGRMFWDGRAGGMQDLVLKPVKNHVEMKFSNLQQLCRKLEGIAYYPELFRKAFGSNAIDTTRIQTALAEFLSNFTFSNTRFQKSLQGLVQLTPSEENGRALFFGKAKCSNCHHLEDNFAKGNGYGFTDFDANIGLDADYTDNGRGEVSGDIRDRGKFMVPVLLNVEFTAPYMHDGRFSTLDQVVEHYNSGVKDHPNLSPNLRDVDENDPGLFERLDVNHDGFISDEEIRVIKPQKLNLTITEKRNLVSFLKTLSDGNILSDTRFSDPFYK